MTHFGKRERDVFPRGRSIIILRIATANYGHTRITHNSHKQQTNEILFWTSTSKTHHDVIRQDTARADSSRIIAFFRANCCESNARRKPLFFFAVKPADGSSLFPSCAYSPPVFLLTTIFDITIYQFLAFTSRLWADVYLPIIHTHMHRHTILWPYNEHCFQRHLRN